MRTRRRAAAGGASVTEVRVSVQDPQQGWTRACRRWCPRPRRLGAQAPGLERVRAAAAGGLDEVLDALTVDGVRRAPDCVAVEEGAPLRVVARGGACAVLSGPGVEQEFRSAGRGPWVDDDAPHGTTAVDLRTGREVCSGPSSPFSRSRPPSTRPRRSCTRPRRRPRRWARTRRSPPVAARECRAGWVAAARPAPAAPAVADEVEDLPSCTTCSARPSTGGPRPVQRGTLGHTTPTAPLRARHRPGPDRGCGRLRPVTPRVRADPSAAE